MIKLHHQIIEFDVDTSGQVITIDRRIPLHLIRCKGIIASVSGFPQTNLNQLLAGSIDSVCFNEKMDNPFSYPVWYNRTYPFFRMPVGDVLNTHVSNNSRVFIKYTDAGTMKDNNGSFIPYKIQLVIKYEKEVK